MKVAGNLHTRKRRKYMLQSVKEFNLPNFTKKLINDGPRRGSGAVRYLRLKIQPVTENRDLVDAFSFWNDLIRSGCFWNKRAYLKPSSMRYTGSVAEYFIECSDEDRWKIWGEDFLRHHFIHLQNSRFFARKFGWMQARFYLSSLGTSNPRPVYFPPVLLSTNL